MTVGRPSDYSEEIAAKICSMVADGMTVRELCKQEGMPAKSTVFLWLSRHKEFSDQYARAKEAQADDMADEILDIADNATNDWMERNAKEDRGWVENGEAMQRSRLRVDARKWLMSKMAPKKYGEKIVQEHQGPDGGPIQINRIELVSPGHDEQPK